MALIDFGLLDTNAPARIANSIQAGKQNALATQRMQQETQLNALQLDRAKRDMGADDAVRNALASGDLESAAQTLLKGGYYKQAQELQKQAAEKKAARIGEAKQWIDITKSALDSVYNNPTLESATSALDFLDQTFGNPQITQQHRANIAKLGNNPEAIRQWAGQLIFSAKDALPKTQYEDVGDKFVPLETNSLAPGYSPQPIQKTLTPGEQAKVGRGESGGTPYFTPVQSGQGVYAFNNRTGRMELVQAGEGAPVIGSASDPALQGKIAAAKEGGKVEAEAKSKAKVDLSKTVQEADLTVKLIDDLLNHPGLEAAVGASSMLGTQKIPGTHGKDFMNRLDQLKGKQFLQAFQTLKGGGQITEAEGQKATDAMSRMKNTSSEAEFKKAAEEFKSIVKKGADRARVLAGETPTESKKPGNAVEIKFMGFE